MEFRRLAEDGWKALFQALFEHAPEALFVLDAAGRVVDLNRRASEALGQTREELIGRCPVEFDVNWRQAFPPGSEASLAGSPVSFQTRHKRKDGTVFPVQARVVPLGHDGNRMSLFFAQDVSERESTQSALQASEERFRTLVELSFNVDEQRLLREIGGQLPNARTGAMAFRKLAESERRLEAAQRLAAVGWWERDFQTGHVSLSDESCRIFGVRPLDLPQWQDRWVGLIHPDDRARASAAAAAALAGGPRYDIEYRIVRPDGTLRVVHSQGDVTWDESGRPLRQFGVMQDITELWQASAERKRVEAELRARQELLDLAQKAARAVAFDLYIGTRENQNAWSPELEAMFGLGPGTYDGSYQGWKKLIHPDDWPIVKAAIERANASGELTAEYRVVHKDGSVHWLRARGRMFFDASGQPERIVGFMFDVTDWFQAMEALRASEDSFRTVFDRAMDAFFLLDKELKIIDVNRQACESLGRSREELIGMHPRDFDVDMDEAALRDLEQRTAPDEPLTFETRHRRKDGTVFPVEIRTGSFRRGGHRCYLALARDITDRKRADEALRASEARFRTFVDRATDAFFLFDEQVTVVDVNRQACESLGYSREELVGMHPRQFDATLNEAGIELVTARARAGETVTFETRHRRRDGSEFPVEVRSGTFRRGEQLLYIALARDISERKLAEETLRAKDQALQAARAELARVSRVMTMGELTASIAHEVNQPLAAMVANAAAAKRWLAADPPQMERAGRALQSISDDGRRAGEVIQRIRALVQRRPARMAPVGVNDTIRNVLALAQTELRSNRVVLSRRLAEDLPSVLGDEVQLQQVLLNLIVNAIEAMGTVKDRPRELTITSGLARPQWVQVEVRDTGPGFEGEDVDRVFEAFHTTKTEGLGIGLSISRSIIEAHGGLLSAEHNVPHGAIFRFTLPVQEGADA